MSSPNNSFTPLPWLLLYERQSEDTPYSRRKAIILPEDIAVTAAGEMIIPLRDKHHIWSYQLITPTGAKSWRKGYSAVGLFYQFGNGRNYVICEGFATGATLHEVTGMTVRCAMSKGNIASVITENTLAIFGDSDDHNSYKLPDERDLPLYKPEGSDGRDWNDYKEELKFFRFNLQSQALECA